MLAVKADVTTHEHTPTNMDETNFDPTTDAQLLYTTLQRALTTWKRRLTCQLNDAQLEEIFDIVTTRSFQQRQNILTSYQELPCHRDLIEDLKLALAGDLSSMVMKNYFSYLVIARFLSPEDFLIKDLKRGIYDTNEKIPAEILCTRTRNEVKVICEAYFKKYNVTVSFHISENVEDKYFRMLLLTVMERDKEGEVNQDRARAEAKEFRDTDDEKTVIKFFAKNNLSQVHKLMEEYEKLNVPKRTSVKDALEHFGFDSDFHTGLAVIVLGVRNLPEYYAIRLRRSLTRCRLFMSYNTVLRIIVTRSDTDLAAIKEAYQRLYSKSLRSEIEDKIKDGKFKRALLIICGD